MQDWKWLLSAEPGAGASAGRSGMVQPGGGAMAPGCAEPFVVTAATLPSADALPPIGQAWPVAHHERLRVPVTWWVLAAVGVLMLFLAYDVALGGWVAAAAATVAALAGGAWLLSQSSLVVAADERGLTAGSAQLPTWAIGDVEALDAEQTALARGRGADPHAFFMLRGYVRTSVRVQVDDPADPVPYWLVSTREPQALAAALVAVRDVSRSGE